MMADFRFPPSRFGFWILTRAVHGEIRDSALASFEEEFNARVAQKGSGLARLWFWRQVINSLPFFLFDGFWWGFVMARAYLTVAWRDLKNHKVFTAINIFGLSTGLACGILVLLFVQNEMSFDRYHENADHIYRVVRRIISSKGEQYSTITPWAMKALAFDNFPEVLNASRLDFYRRFILEYGEKRFYSDILYADQSLLEIFTFPLVRGDKASVLKDPDNVVLSEATARKFFDKEDPIGKTIFTYYEDKKYPFRVSGILKNVPKNSHFGIDVLIPIEHLVRRYAKEPHRLNSCATYLLLDPRADPKAMEQKASDLSMRFPGSRSSSESYLLQPLRSIYLHSEKILSGDITSRPAASIALSIVAFLILLIACFNFVNLSTARASRRFREIGQRRVIGATRAQLFAQFLGESLFLSFVSLAIAVILARVLLPIFNSMINRNVPLEAARQPRFFIGVIVLTSFVGIFSGLYPSLVFSSLKPVEILRRTTRLGGRSGIHLRRGLIVLQFTLAVIFIVATVIVTQQIRFIQTKDLGFRKENILWVSIMRDPNLPKSPEAIQNALCKVPNIEKAIVTFFPPGLDSGQPASFQPEGFAGDNPVTLSYVWVGQNFFDFFGIGFLHGREFSSERPADASSSIILNESAVQYLDWKEPLGKTVQCDWIEKAYNRPGPYTVIGVVKDFHNAPLQVNIHPTIYLFDPGRLFSICIQLSPRHIPETLVFVEETLKELNAVQPFEFRFLDDMLTRDSYKSDQSIRRVFSLSSILALILSGLGVLGLVSFTTERKKKEIAIRKVLGATTSTIVRMISREFAILVFIAGIVSLPASLWITNYYLRNFAYQIDVTFWPFLLAPAAVLLLSLGTAGAQSTKAATMNPSDALRHE